MRIQKDGTPHEVRNAAGNIANDRSKDFLNGTRYPMLREKATADFQKLDRPVDGTNASPVPAGERAHRKL